MPGAAESQVGSVLAGAGVRHDFLIMRWRGATERHGRLRVRQSQLRNGHVEREATACSRQRQDRQSQLYDGCHIGREATACSEAASRSTVSTSTMGFALGGKRPRAQGSVKIDSLNSSTDAAERLCPHRLIPWGIQGRYTNWHASTSCSCSRVDQAHGRVLQVDGGSWVRAYRDRLMGPEGVMVRLPLTVPRPED